MIIRASRVFYDSKSVENRKNKAYSRSSNSELYKEAGCTGALPLLLKLVLITHFLINIHGFYARGVRSFDESAAGLDRVERGLVKFR